MEHPLQVEELPHADTPLAITAEPPPAPLAAAGPAPLPPLPDLPSSDVLFLTPADTQYRAYLPAANTRTQLSPALRAVCKSADAVAVMVDWVRSNQLSFAVRCGGHSYEGFSQSTDVVIDLRGMADVTVDTTTNFVTAGSGAALYHIYEAVAAQGLGLQAGSCPTVGISGHILGGGHGLLARSHGLTCDGIDQVTLVETEFLAQRRHQGRDRSGRRTQADSGQRNIREITGQCGKIDGNLALWIAVVSIDADQFERPVAIRCRYVEMIPDCEF